jgi:alpha-D-xyloside xylohydrolase
MVMEFMQDPTCAYLDKQYMLGDKLLIAPIFNEEGMAHYYLPEGSWTDYLTGEKKEGGRWYKEYRGYLSIPMMVKEGSILAIGAKDEDAVYDYSENVVLKVYDLVDQVPSTTVVYNQKSELSLEAKLLKQGNTITIEVNTAKNYSIVLVNCTAITSIENGSFEIKDNNTVITPGREGAMIVKLI